MSAAERLHLLKSLVNKRGLSDPDDPRLKMMTLIVDSQILNVFPGTCSIQSMVAFGSRLSYQGKAVQDTYHDIYRNICNISKLTTL